MNYGEFYKKVDLEKEFKNMNHETKHKYDFVHDAIYDALKSTNKNKSISQPLSNKELKIKNSDLLKALYGIKIYTELGIFTETNLAILSKLEPYEYYKNTVNERIKDVISYKGDKDE